MNHKFSNYLKKSRLSFDKQLFFKYFLNNAYLRGNINQNPVYDVAYILNLFLKNYFERIIFFRQFITKTLNA